MKKILFLDRDGTLILETEDFKIEKFEKLTFYPEVFYWLRKIVDELDYLPVMVSNQDGLGSEQFPADEFWKVQRFIEDTFAHQGIRFVGIHIDTSFPEQHLPTRKPGIGMLQTYLNGDYDIKNSLVIGDRITDVMLAKNLGCKCIWLNDGRALGAHEITEDEASLRDHILLQTRQWREVYEFLKYPPRIATCHRQTRETDIQITLNLDGSGETHIDTSIGFFDHLLEQFGRHASVDLTVKAQGDLHIDEHHTIEDTALALGEAFASALSDKKGIERYGFLLPMDDARVWAAIDFSGRPWLEWDADFKREKIGDMPTEMFYHFFKSFSDASKSNLHIKARGKNEHHKIEAIFKAVARCVKQAIKREGTKLPTTKGVL